MPQNAFRAGSGEPDGPAAPPDPCARTGQEALRDDTGICDGCRRSTAPGAGIRTVRGARVCDACTAGQYRQCAHCSGWNRADADCGNDCDDTDDEDEDDDWEDEDEDGTVYDYGYKPVPVFHGRGPLFLGLELEIETPWAYAGRCVAIAASGLGDLGYLKADSSIAHGFEVVTHPMSYDWAIAHFPWSMLTRLRESACAATEDTGIHVHLSRAGFVSPCHAYRWMKFIYRNQPDVTALARRSCPQWAAFTDDDRRAARTYAKGAHGARHRAINTANADTFELRVFASSLDPGQVQAALAFASASVQYTRDLSVPAITGQGGWTWAAFVRWLDQQPAYRPLTRELQGASCAC